MSYKYSGFRTSFRGHLEGLSVLIFLGLILALGGNVYQYIQVQRLSRDITTLHQDLQKQITRLSDATSGAFDVAQQRFEHIQKLEDSSAASLLQAQLDLRRRSSQLADTLDTQDQALLAKNEELLKELADLKRETNTRLQSTGTTLESNSAKLQNTTTTLDRTRAELNELANSAERNQADLKRIATKANLATAYPAGGAGQTLALRKVEDGQDYFDFDLLKTKTPTMVGPVQIAIRSTDPKRNRYSMDLYVGGRIQQQKSSSVNEPVRLYVAGRPAPYEIVVKEVRKDEAIGYVVEPKAIASGPAAANTFRASSQP